MRVAEFSRGGDSIHARATDVSLICIYEWRGSPKRGHSICSVENNITCTHCNSRARARVYVCMRDRQREREKKEMASRAEGMMKKAGGHAVRSGQSRRTHEHPVPRRRRGDQPVEHTSIGQRPTTDSLPLASSAGPTGPYWLGSTCGPPAISWWGDLL